MLVVVSFSVKSQDLISGGANSWIFHTPDDRTSLLVAPKTNSAWDWAKATQFYSNGNVSFTGKVGIGTTSPNAKLHVEGVIQAGDKDSTKGGIFLAQKYGGNDYIGTLSSNYSSGALILGYGAAGMKDEGVAGQLVSTFDNFSAKRSALRLSKGTLEFLSTPNAVQTTVGNELSVKSRFYIDENGNAGIGTSNPGAKLQINDAGTYDVTTLQLNNRIKFRGDGVVSWGPAADFGVLSWVGDKAIVGAKSTKNLSLQAGGEEKVIVKTDGNVGIGTSTPGAKQEIYVESGGPGVNALRLNTGFTGGNHVDINPYISGFSNDGLEISLAGTRRFVINSDGKVGIGTTTTGSHRLAVEGSIGAREIKVEATGWSDFVFEKEYSLPTLDEVETHIKEKGHLKDIPSEKEVLKNGIYLGEMDAKLLQKIEELTLYTIQQEKKIKEQEEKIKKQEEELKSLKDLSDRLSKLEKLLKSK